MWLDELLGKYPFASQAKSIQVEHDHEAHPHSTEEVPSKEGREPVRVNGHDPVPSQRGAEHREKHQEQSPRRYMLVVQIRAAYFILSQAPLAEHAGENQEGRDVDQGAHPKERSVQIRTLVGDDVVEIGVGHAPAASSWL